MAEKLLISGNEAIARGAIQADCKYFFGYPITPQSDIPEYMSKELPKIGGVFVQSESETASIYMVYGGAMTGERVMTSTSSPGFSLMQEGVSNIAWLGMPCVVVNVTRQGPGMGSTQNGQTDYRQATKGGGHGGYRNIVLAPSSCQECFDFVQLAFYLAETYMMMVLVLSDYVVGLTAEPVEIRSLELGPVPAKPWALIGKGKKDGKRNVLIGGDILLLPEKYDKVIANEIRYDTYRTEDADLLIVAYGSSARFAKGAVDLARAEGRKVGLFRPITLWPFPEEALREAAIAAGKVLVVEDSIGELVDDVRDAVRHQLPVHLLGVWGRHIKGPSGLIQPEKILDEIREVQ